MQVPILQRLNTRPPTVDQSTFICARDAIVVTSSMLTDPYLILVLTFGTTLIDRTMSSRFQVVLPQVVLSATNRFPPIIGYP